MICILSTLSTLDVRIEHIYQLNSVEKSSDPPLAVRANGIHKALNDVTVVVFHDDEKPWTSAFVFVGLGQKLKKERPCSPQESIKVSEVFCVDEQGEPQSSKASFSDFKTDQVYLVIDHDKRKIFVWKGVKAPVRQKFTSARAASNFRMQYGMTYKIDSLDQGIEGRDFLALYGLEPSEKPPSAAARVAVEPSTPIAPSVASSRPAPSGGPVVTARPGGRPTVTRPVTTSAPASPTVTASSSSGEATTPATPAAKAPEVTVTTTAPKGYQPGASFSLKEVEEKLKELGEPPDMIREIVIMGDTVFSVIKEYLPLFDREVVKLEVMTDLPPGAFPASDYETRILIGEGGKVVFVELLRSAPESERDEFVSEMKRSLKDLTKLGI